MQDPLFIQAGVSPAIETEQDLLSLGDSPTRSPREGIQPAAQITRSGWVVQDAACFQHVSGIGSVFFEAVIQPNRHDVFGRFTDKPPTISSSVELITCVFAFYEQESLKPLQVWTDSSALYHGGPAHPYERYLAQQGVEHFFGASARVKPATERYFSQVRRFFAIARLRFTSWTLDDLWNAFEAWDRAARGAVF